MLKYKPLVWICVIVFILVLGGCTASPLLAIYAKNMGANGIWIGFLFSAIYVTRLILGIPVGHMADIKGPKIMLTISLLIYPLAAILYWLANNLYLLLLARLLQGIASVMMLPVAMAYVGSISPLGREGQYMGIYNTVVFLAYGLGPILGGLIADKYAIKSVFIYLFLLSICSLFLVFFLPRTSLDMTSQYNSDKNLKDENNTSTLLVKDLWKNSDIIALSAISVINAVLSMHVVSFFILFVKDKQSSFLFVGLLIALFNIIIGAFQVPLGKISDNANKFLMITCSTIAIIVTLFIFPFIHSLQLMLAFIIFLSLSSAILIAAYSGLSTELGKKIGLGSVMGFLGAAESLGMIIGPILSGLIFDKFKIEYTFYFIGLLWIIGLIIFGVLWSKKQSKNNVFI